MRSYRTFSPLPLLPFNTISMRSLRASGISKTVRGEWRRRRCIEPYGFAKAVIFCGTFHGITPPAVAQKAPTVLSSLGVRTFLFWTIIPKAVALPTKQFQRNSICNKYTKR